MRILRVVSHNLDKTAKITWFFTEYTDSKTPFTGEMACSVPLINGISQEWALAKRHVSEDIFGVQLCGNSPQLVAYATQVIKENCEVDFIDLNLGCPIELIYGQVICAWNFFSPSLTLNLLPKFLGSWKCAHSSREHSRDHGTQLFCHSR